MVAPGPVVGWGPGPVAVYSEIGYTSLYEKKRDKNGLGLAYRAGYSVGFYNNLFYSIGRLGRFTRLGRFSS